MNKQALTEAGIRVTFFTPALLGVNGDERDLAPLSLSGIQSTPLAPTYQAARANTSGRG